MEYICRGKGEYSGKWCIQRKQRGEAKEPGCDIVQCIDDRLRTNKNWNKRIRQSIRRGNRTRFPRISRRGSRNRKVHIIASGVPETGGQAEEGALHFR